MKNNSSIHNSNWFLSVFIVYLSICANLCYAQNITPAYGDAIVVGSIADASTLIPILASDSASGEICSLVFNGLIKYDKNIELVPDLAKSWDISDDGITIIFHLRDDVRWHDGAGFTSADVKFTYEKLIDPNVKTPYSGDFEKIKNVELIDDYTLRVTYKEPFAPGLSSWGMFIMPKHLLENENINNASFSRHPIGTGPYRFKRWRSAQLIELESNPDYFEGRPYIDRYIYRVIPDQSTLFLELRTQGVDYIGLSALQYKRQTETNFFKKNFNRFRYPSFGYTYIGYNLKDERFKDKRVRQALNFAIDKQELIDGVLIGLGRVCTGPFVPESWAYNKEVMPAPFGAKQAIALLKEAGWQDTDNDGWLDKEGKRFEFTLMTNQGNEQRRQTAEIIQRRLKDIGIRVNIEIVEWSSFINEFIDKRNFEAVLLGWGLSREPDPYDIWHSSKTKEGEFNFIGYSNPQVDALIEEGRRIFDRQKRQAIYHKIHKLLYDEQPCTFLYIPDALPIINKRFRGVEVAPIGIGHNFIKWWVPLSEQRYTR